MNAPAHRISSRWTPAHIVRLDTERGTFEEINSRLHSSTEARAQRALLAKQQARMSGPAKAIAWGITFLFAVLLAVHIAGR
jgi:hypothetical protein